MNHLAHAFLSGGDEHMLLGNLMGDFVKGSIDAELPANVQRGVRLHRLIDSYTDAHPAFHRSRERLDKPFRRYAGILVDIFYDHFLSKYWHLYSAQPLPDYAQTIYKLLQREHDMLPLAMKQFVSYMVGNDILVAYGSMDGIHKVLKGMSRRLSFENPLADGIGELAKHYDGLYGDFSVFLPDIVEYTHTQVPVLQQDANSAQAR